MVNERDIPRLDRLRGGHPFLHYFLSVAEPPSILGDPQRCRPNRGASEGETP